MIEKFTLVIIVTIRKAEVPFAYMCICVGKEERVKQEKNRDDEKKRRIKNVARYIFLPYLTNVTGLFSFSLKQHPSLLLWLSCSNHVTAAHTHTHTLACMRNKTNARLREREKHKKGICTHLIVFRTISTITTTTTTTKFSKSTNKALKCHWYWWDSQFISFFLLRL